MNWIKQWLGSEKVSLDVIVDHVELTSTHLVVGLQMGWTNRTDKPIPIKEIQVKLYLHGKRSEPLGLYPLERFTRVPNQRGFHKTPMRPLTLPVKEIHVEQIRFISQEVLDLPVGKYPLEVIITDTSDISYTNQISILVESAIKYRLSEEWQLD